MEVAAVDSATGESCVVCVREDETVGSLQASLATALFGSSVGPNALALSLDGTYLGGAATRIAATPLQSHSTLDVAHTGPNVVAPHEYSVECESLAVSPCGTHLALGCEGNNLAMYCTESGALEWQSSTPLTGTWTVQVRFSRNGARIASAHDASAHIWDAHSGTLLRSFAHTEDVSAIALSPCTQHLFVAGETGTLLRTNDQRSSLTYSGHTAWVSDVVCMGTQVVSASQDGTVRVWVQDTAECERVLRVCDSGTLLCSMAVSDCGAYVATAEGRTGHVNVWSLATGECRHSLKGKGHVILSTGRVITRAPHDTDTDADLDESQLLVYSLESGARIHMQDETDAQGSCFGLAATKCGRYLFQILDGTVRTMKLEED